MLTCGLPCFVIASSVALLSACRPDHRTHQHGATTVRLVNATDAPLCEAYVAPTTSKLWGSNWLDREIRAGEHIDLPMRPDSYMMRLGKCGAGTALVVYHFDVEHDVDFVVHDGYDTPPPSREVDQLAFPTSKHLGGGKLRHVVAAPLDVEIVDVTVTSRCARDLRLIVGGDPQRRTGVPSTVAARSFARYSAPESTPLWIVDATYRPVSSVTLRADQSEIEIAASCEAWTPG